MKNSILKAMLAAVVVLVALTGRPLLAAAFPGAERISGQPTSESSSTSFPARSPVSVYSPAMYATHAGFPGNGTGAAGKDGSQVPSSKFG